MKPTFAVIPFFLLWALSFSVAGAQTPKQSPPDNDYEPDSVNDTQGSTYIPVDSWIYPALDRLHALGYLDSAFLGLRPWTRLSIAHMLQLSADRIESDANNEEAKRIYLAVLREVKPDLDRTSALAHPSTQLESVYTDIRGIGGTPLRDSFHLGQTIIDDYGRPCQSGFNNSTGFSARAEAGRFSLYFRGEVQHAPSAAGYSPTLAAFLSNSIDGIPYAANVQQDTIPAGPIATANDARVMEANLSYHLLGHEVSFGKSDHWLGPDKGAAMLWSNNAENIYDFEINRVEPLRIPLVSRLMGPIRYDFFVGSLKGHTYPNDPWAHVEKISFKPTRDLEFGFDRLAVWGGNGGINPNTGQPFSEPITLHTFLKSFFSFQNVYAEKGTRDDPGARFGTFDFSYRLPLLSHWMTLYTDSLVHDDVNPISAPRRSGVHPGIYLARFPKFEHLDLRIEGANTEPTSHYNPDGSPINQGKFLYWETVQRQGPTNKGFLVGDWVGREGKGGQAWLTYHLSPQEEIQFSYRNAKASKDFIPGGTTQNDFAVQVRKRIHKDFEVVGSVQYESWKAPIYQTNSQSDAVSKVQFTWFPRDSK